MTLEVRIEGINELTKHLDGISVMTRGKAGQTALRNAAKVIAAQIESNARRIDDPATPESIPVNVAIRQSTRFKKATGDLKFRIGIQGGAQTPDSDEEERKNAGPGGATFYWRMLEFGTSRARARPFVRPAVRQKAQEALNTFVREYNKSLDRFLKRGIT